MLNLFQDLKFFKSIKTGRGPLTEDWQEKTTPVMCTYKVVQASFEVWGLQTRVEELIHQVFDFKINYRFA